MTFLYPMMLWALALPLLLAVLAVLRRHRAGRGWQRLVSPGHAAELVVRTPAWRGTLPTVLMLLALTGGILAAARPINGYTTTEAMATGRNLLIALDISRSMETQDVKPSRLEEARAAAFELVDALPGDKIGLIVFSGEADLVVPLTYDHTALRDALEQVNRGWAGYGGTNFGLVLRKAMQDFSRSAPTGTNALVIFSDGEDTVGSSLDVAKEAREHNLLVITVGVGTSIGESIPDERGENGLYQDAAGKHVISKLDTAALQRFADATGGSYFTMGSGADLAAFAREAVKRLDTHEESFSSHKVPRDIFAPFAITSLVLLLAAMVLASEWKGSRGAATLLALLLTLGGAQPLSAAPQERSIRAYEDALAQMGSDADKAREGFSAALLDEDSGIQAASLYQLGNLNTRATFDRLRALYGTPTAQASPSPDEEDEEIETMDAAPSPHQPSPEQLQEIVDELQQNLRPYHDALGIRPTLKEAQANIRSIEAFIKKLREEIERLKQQQQQNQQQQDQQQQDEQQNQSQQNQQQDGDGQQDEQNKQNDQQNQQGEQEQPENPKENEGDQQEQPQDQQPNDQQGEQDSPEQQEQLQQEEEDNKNESPQPQQQRPQPAQPQQQQQAPMSEQQKAEQRAASILRMHVDEEKGSPIPHVNDSVRPPEKDY